MKTIERHYAGIGSRETPSDVAPLITFVAKKLNEHDFVLRSGAAEGADTMFEAHAHRAEIWLPWRGFMQRTSPLFTLSKHAFEIAERVHPAWDKLNAASRKLHARNVHQVLGEDLATPVEFVVCWTPNGEAVGGTATAIKLAELCGITVVNLFHYPPLLRNLLDVRLDVLIGADVFGCERASRSRLLSRLRAGPRL